MPAIVPRSRLACERGDRPRESRGIAPAVRLAVVHHTAGTNSYTPAQAAAIVRGIEVYHVQGNGWNDIGYNFLVDRFGTVYEGRAGGIDRNVIGAHSEGFNSGTVGVALIGNFTNATPPQAMQDALVKLLAWRLDVAHVDPLSTVVYTSGGNYKFKAGRLVTLRAISGPPRHRPERVPRQRRVRAAAGDREARLADRAAEALLADGRGVLGGPVRFQARVSSALPWTVTITDQLGTIVASGAGRGPLVDWTWNAPAAGARAAFTWTIAARARGRRRARSVSGRPVPPPALSLTNLVTLPVVVAPAADGTGDRSTVTFTLGAAADRDGPGARSGRRPRPRGAVDPARGRPEQFHLVCRIASGRPLPARCDGEGGSEERDEDRVSDG